MNWLQISLALGTQEAAEFETVLQAHGAVAVTYESQADEVVLEPKPGEIPLWQHINLVALFSIDTNIAGLNEALRVLDAKVHERLDVAFVAEEDWQKRLANHTVSAEFGGRLLLSLAQYPWGQITDPLPTWPMKRGCVCSSVFLMSSFL